MIAYWCGFNGFNQILPAKSSIASSQFSLIPLDNIEDIDCGWSCSIVLSAGDVYMSGFCGTQSSFLKKLIKPDSELKFLKVACNETYALLTSEVGDCWQYFYNTEKWKKLLKFISVEETFDAVSSECSDTLLSNVVRDEVCASGKDKKAIIKICCGETVNIALDSCGQAYSIPSPILMPGIKVIEVACGFEHCLLLDAFGRVFSSGSGMRGQLGNGALETVDAPQEIETLSGLHVVHIAAGGWHSAAVTAAGGLYMWGWNNSGQLGYPTVESSDAISSSEQGVKQKNIQAETSLSNSDTQDNLLSKDQEKVENCDSKESTERDVEEHGKKYPDGHKCKKMKLTELKELEKLVDLTQSSKSEMQDMKLTKMYKERKEGSDACRDTSVEQKEFVTVLAVPSPVEFSSEKAVDVVDVSCGNRHTVVLAGDSTVWGCGWNAYGQLGKSSDIFSSVDHMIQLDILVEEKICQIHCGGWNTVIFCKR